ncbi:MAG: hypothetical protein AAFR59_17815, partial [Bacteroidota bacterium]
MYKIGVKCILESDLILTSTTATEGFFKSLDYIPGAKFMGLAAKSLYKMDVANQEKTLDLFHRGKVFYGDAHPIIDGKPSFRVPFDWHKDKKEEGYKDIYLYHLIDRDTRVSLEEGVQLKQLREGYVTEDCHFFKISQNFSLKSPFNNRKSRAQHVSGESFEESQLFGYYSLPGQTEWYFTLESENKAYLADVLDILVNASARMGRSSSAEYGAARFEPFDAFDSFDPSRQASSQANAPIETPIYAFSNLCFYDDLGNPTGMPSPKDLNLPENAKILWNKSRIRTRRYASYNKKRNARNADRLIIEKGSVIMISHE